MPIHNWLFYTNRTDWQSDESGGFGIKQADILDTMLNITLVNHWFRL